MSDKNYLDTIDVDLEGMREIAKGTAKDFAESQKLVKTQQAEIERLRKVGEQSAWYAVALQCAIEHFCHDGTLPDSIASECPYHAEMIREKQGRQAAEIESLQAINKQLVELGQEVMHGLTVRNVVITKLADSVQRFRELINRIEVAKNPDTTEEEK